MIELSRVAIITFIVTCMAQECKISTEVALRRFMVTHTYALLQSNSSKLWLESPEYVLDMLHAELNNDIKSWLEI